MIASTEHKLYQKKIKKGQGSILRAIRIDKGGGMGLIAGGLIPAVMALLGVPFITGGNIPAGLVIIAFFGVPALLLIVIGFRMKRKRASTWMAYYQEETGYSEGELQQIDRELASASTSIVLCKASSTAMTYNYIAGFFTDHYVLINGVDPYLRRLDDFIAVAFSDSTNIWFMASLTTLDEETRMIPLFTYTYKKPELCGELMQEICRRNPRILCGQEIACDGKNYILERDGAQLLRLYQEGRTLEPAK